MIASQWPSGNGDRHPSSCAGIPPEPQHPGASPRFQAACRWTTAGLLAVALGFSATVNASAQETLDPVIETLGAKASQFLDGVGRGSTQTAFRDLLEGSPLARRTEAVTSLVEQASKLKDRFGEYRASERIMAKRIGADVVLMRYLYKCDDFPVVWYFTFYRSPARGETEPGNGWRVITVRFDTELELLGL
jgi:hypothetical protein